MVEVRLATAFDSGYLPFATAMVATLAAHRAPGTSVDLAILHPGGIDDRHRAELERTASGIRVSWHEVADATYATHGLAREGLLAQPAYFRCLLAEVLPGWDRVVYIDADTMVLDDLAELYRTPLDGAPVAAVLDWLPVVSAAVAPWRELGLDGNSPYFNSGVLVIDLDSWRREGIGPMAMRRCLADERHLAADGRWMQHDQYGLNVVLHRRWLALDGRWNHFSELPASDPAVVHMVGNGKPWNPKCLPEFADRFYDLIASTRWAGWRRDERPGAAREAAVASGFVPVGAPE